MFFISLPPGTFCQKSHRVFPPNSYVMFNKQSCSLTKPCYSGAKVPTVVYC